MDAYLSTSQNRSNCLDTPPILIAADSESAIARARQTAALSGLRVAEAGDLEGAPDRIRRQAFASALWIELDGEGGNAAQAVLDDEIAADVSSGRYSAVLAAPLAVLEDLGRHALSPGSTSSPAMRSGQRHSRSLCRAPFSMRASPMSPRTRTRFACGSSAKR